jgi:uncharacterized membrane protein YkvI
MKWSRVFQFLLLIVVFVIAVVVINSGNSTPDNSSGVPAQFQP